MQMGLTATEHRTRDPCKAALISLREDGLDISGRSEGSGGGGEATRSSALSSLEIVKGKGMKTLGARRQGGGEKEGRLGVEPGFEPSQLGCGGPSRGKRARTADCGLHKAGTTHGPPQGGRRTAPGPGGGGTRRDPAGGDDGGQVRRDPACGRAGTSP